MRKGVFLTLFFLVLGITLSGQTTRVRLKQLELAPDTLFRYVIIADTSTQVAEWAKLDSLGLGGGTTLYLRGDAGTLSTLANGDTIDIKTGSGLSTWGKTPNQILITLDSTGVTPGTYNFATVTVGADGRTTMITAGYEVDGSITNEGMLGVAAGGANSATIYTNTSGNAGTSIAGGWGVAITETTSANGGTVTITADSSQVATQYDISGFISGSGTSGRVPRFTGTRIISDGVLRDDGTLLALGGATVSGYSFYDYSTGAWRLAVGTTAQRPGTPVAGAIRLNSSNNALEYYTGSAWEVPAESSTANGMFTAGSVLFADAAGRVGQDNSNFYFDDTNNRLGIGTTSPIFEVAAVKDNADTGMGSFSHSNTATRRPVFALLRTRGTAASRTAVVSGDGVGSVTGNGFDGSGYQTTARLDFVVDGTVSTGTIPQRVTVVTGTTEANRANRFTVSSAGRIGIAVDAPSYILDINSTDAVRMPRGTSGQRPTGVEGLFRYNQSVTDFEGHNGTRWLTWVGTNGTGATSNTIRHNGTDWEPTSLLSIGTSSVTITSSSATGLNINTTTGTGAAIVNSGSVGLTVTTTGNTAATFTSDNNTSLLMTGASTGGTGFAVNNTSAGTQKSWVFYNVGSDGTFGVGRGAFLFRQTNDNINAMVFATDGKIGLQQNAPAYSLDINNTDAVRLPVGTTAQRPTASAGILRYNSSTAGLEYNTGSSWVAVGSGSGSMSSWTLAGTSGTPQTVSDGQTATIAAGYGVTTTAAATRTVTVAADTTKLATPYDLSQIATIYNSNGSINVARTIDLDYTTGSFNLTWDNGAGNTREFTLGDGASTAPAQDGLWYADYAGTNAGEFQVNDALAYLAVATGATQSSVQLTNSTVETATTTETHTLTATGAANWSFGSGTKITFINPGYLGINDTSPESEADIAGTVKVRKLVGQDNTPSIVTNANAGTGRSAALTTSQSSDVSGRFYITTGTTLTAGEWAVVSFASAYSVAPVVILQAEDADAAELALYLYVVPTTTGFSVAVNASGAGLESRTFEWGYHVIGGK